MKKLLNSDPSTLSKDEIILLHQYATQLDQELQNVREEKAELEEDLKEVASVMIEAAKAVNIEKIMNAKNTTVALTQEVLAIFSPSPFERNKKPLMERFTFFSKLGPIYMKHKDKFIDLSI